MVRQRRIRTLLGVGVACALSLAALAPGAVAGTVFVPPDQTRARGALTIAPQRPLDSNPLTVTWKTDRPPKPGWTYVVSAGSGDGSNCSSGVQRTIKPTWKRKGAVLRFTLRPTDEPLWCPTDARVQIDAVTRAGRFVALAQRTVTILDNTATPALDPPGQNLTLTVQEGSALTVRVPGRPDRSAPLSGSMGARSLMPRGPLGRYSRSEFLVKSVALSLGALPPDPACTGNGRAFPSPVAINPRTSNLWSAAPVDAVPSAVPRDLPPVVTYLLLGFDEDPLGLTGCQGTAVAGALRPLTLVVQSVTVFSVDRYTMRGSLSGLKLSDGTEATIDFTLVLTTTFLSPPAAPGGG